ncbi:hypothetical protein OAS14_04465 [Alphaproteobacteria bacterium]|nr:hypothetical protein [Alphaproteobacteria bacterium]
MKNPYSEIEYCELYGPTAPGCKFIHSKNIFGILDACKNSFRTLPGFTLFHASTREMEAFFELYKIQKAFILCRSVTGQSTKTKNGIFSFEPRGLIGFEGLTSENFWDELKKRSRRDSVRALKKWKNGKWSIKCTCDDEDLAEFASMYKRLNRARGISDLYHLEDNQLKNLLRHPNWHLLKVFSGNSVIGFTVIAQHEGNVDQVVLVYDHNERDASRFVVYGSLEFAVNDLAADDYFMGGGITENDTLENYKLSLGAQKKHASMVKYCDYNAPDYHDRLELRGVKWP